MMSIQKWKRKKEKATEEGNLEELFASCSELAVLYTDEEEFENALKEYKEAKQAAEAANNTIKVAVAHRMIGEVYSSMQNYDLAIKHEVKYLELARAHGDAVEEQRALANLGHMYLLKADTFTNPDSNEKQDTLEEANKYNLLSLQVCERLTNTNRKEVTEMQARLYLNLGLTVEQQSKIDSAINYFNKAIVLCKSMDIWEILYRTYNCLACLFQHQSSHSRALEHCDKALNVAQRLQDKNSRTCDLLLLKADILFDLPDFRGAKQCLLKAFKLKTSNQAEVEKRLRTVAAVCRFEEQLLNTPDFDLASKKSLFESLGDGCAAMRSYSKALEYYYLMFETAKNLGESGEELRPCYVSLSQTYKDNKQYDMAIKYFKEELALNTNNSTEACKTTFNIAEVLEIKEAEVEDIITTYQKCLELAKTADNYKLQVRALSSMVQLLKEKNRLSEARKMEAELDNLKQKFGPLLDNSESEEEEENTPDIGADICIEELSDIEMEDEQTSSVRTRKKNAPTKFRRNEKGEYPLHTACIEGNLTHVKKLLDQGHPVNVRDHSGWLPLHEACNLGHTEVVAELLDRGASINDRGSSNCDGLTPLLDAACCGNFSVIRLLLQRGASPVMRTNKGETVLDCLTAWRRRYVAQEKRDLDPDSLREFNDLVKTLKSALKKAGHKPETERSPSPPSQHLTRRQSETSAREKTHRPGVSNSNRRSCEEQELPFRRNFVEEEQTQKPSCSSMRRSTEGISSSLQSSSAAKEYEEAMKSLRRKPVQIHSTMRSPEKETHSALVEEMVDDWLVDDMGTSSSRGVKRRRPQYEGQPQRRPNRLTSPDRRNVLRPISPLNMFSESQQNQVIDQVEEIQDSSETVETTSSDESVLRESNNLPQQSNQQNTAGSRTKTQQPLSVFGVVRNIPRPQPEPDLPASFPPPVSQPYPAYPPPSQIPSSSQMAPPSIKVRVEGKLLLIPLPASNEETPTIAWLADEAAKRFYSFEGVEPVLSLRTEDGAMLAAQDPVSLLLSYREVGGVVTSWRPHPIAQRYRETCADLAVEPDEYLERSLDLSQATFSLHLSGCGLDSHTLDPALRCLAIQTALQHLILPDNRLGDTGMQLLAKLVVKLPHLRELDLTCNGITLTGLNVLVQQIVDHNACKRLEILRLSHNRLGRSCVSPLRQLLQVSRSLTDLSLASVGLSASSFVPPLSFSLECLEKLDVGLNRLDEEAVQVLLGALSVSKVVKLGLAHTGAGSTQAVVEWLRGGQPDRLTTLNLAHCSNSRHNITQLIRCLETAPLLKHLEINVPEEYDREVLQALYRLPLSVLRLTGGSLSPSAPPPPPTLLLSCLSFNSPPWPRAAQGPFGLISFNSFPC